MRSNIKPENRRLLEALCYIDEEVLADVLADVTVPEPSAQVPRKRAILHSIKSVLALAACLLLLSLALPFVSYLIGQIGIIIGGNPAGIGEESDSRVIRTGYQVYGSEVYNERIGRLVRYQPATDEYETLCDHKTCPEGCHFRGIECLSQIVDGKLYYIYDSVWGIDQDIRAAYLDLSTLKSVDIGDISAYSISGKAYVYEGYYYFSREINLPSNRTELYRIPITGGDEEPVLEFDGEGSLFMVADGEIITLNRYDYYYYSTPLVIKAYNIETGKERVLWSRESGNRQSVREPAFLDGKLYFLANADAGYDLMRIDLESGEAECVQSGVSKRYWLMNDGVYYFRFESRTVEYQSMLSSIGDGLYRTDDSASLYYYDFDEKKESVIYKNEDITPCHPSGMVISGGKACGYFCGAFPSLELENAEVLISIDLSTGEIKALDEAYLPLFPDVTVEITEPETTKEEFEIPIPEGGLTFIEHVGEVPDEFKTIIADNLFSNITIINDILARYEKNGTDHIFQLYNKHGKLLSEASVTAENAHMQKMYIDSKGNLIVYFSISYQDASYKNIVYAKIVKFDTSGKIVFNTDVTPQRAGNFDYMVETDNAYIFAGSIDIRAGGFYKGDVYLVEMSHGGDIRNTLQIGTAEEYDNVVGAEKTSSGVRFYLCLQEREEGQTRPEWNYYRCDLSDDLTDPNYTEISENALPEDEPYYYVNGKGYFSIDEFLSDYEWSKYRGSHLIEYDDFVLLVGKRYTSDYDIIENGLSSVLSPKSFYTETVYAAYTKTGELLWLTAVDSTDYDFLRSYYSK